MSRQILVTGASSGIGRTICETLLEAGHQVVGLARDFGKFPCADPRFARHTLDLSDLETLPGHLRDLTATHPQVDALICNAGQGRFGALEEFSYARIRGLMDLNFTSHAFLVRAFLPLLKKAGRGDLVFIGSEAALQGTQKGSLYCASKFALRGFAQALRQECPRAGLRVSIVNPGMVRTPFFDELDFAPGPDPANFVLPEDVAQAVSMILAARPGTVFDEINLSPQKRVIEFGGKKQKGAPR
jgi:short-subunit dehydrogenase